MSNLGISTRNMDLLAQRVKLHIKTETLREGLSLLQMQKIVSLHADNSGYRIHAKIMDKSNVEMIYDLTIDVELFQFSKCSCIDSEYCAHIAAAFLLAYSMSGHNAVQFAGAKKLENKAAALDKKADPTQATGHKRFPPSAKLQPTVKPSEAWKQALSKNEIIVSAAEASAASSTVEQVAEPLPLPLPSQPASQWHRYMDEVLGQLLKTKSIRSDGFIKRGLELLTPRRKGWDSFHEALFGLHVRLSLVHHTYRNINTVFKSDNSSSSFHANQQLSNMMDELYQNAQTMEWHAFFAKHPDRAEELQVLLSKYAFDCASLEIAEYWLGFYRTVWGLYIGTFDGSGETSRLQRALKRAKASSVEYEHISMALAYWEFRRSDDAKAIIRLEKLRHNWNLGVHLTYAHTRFHQSKWDQLLQWLHFIARITAKQSYSYSNPHAIWSRLFDYWSTGAESAATQTGWQAWLLDYIEYLYDDYEQYLLDRKMYKEWFDIMLCTDREPGPQYNSLLNKLENSNPEILLPFYHHTADYWIGRKNREGYRYAVSIIKRLSQMYKKMNDTPRWERYIAHLTQSYSRYRAFQEELKKGKVIA